MSQSLCHGSMQQRLRVAGHILLYGSVGTASSAVVYFLQEQIRQVQKLRPVLESKQRFADALRRHGISEATIQRMRKSTLEDHIKELESRGLVKLELVEDPPKWTSSPHRGQMYHVEYVQSPKQRRIRSSRRLPKDEIGGRHRCATSTPIKPRWSISGPVNQIAGLFKRRSCYTQMRKHWVDRIEKHHDVGSTRSTVPSRSFNWSSRPLVLSAIRRCFSRTAAFANAACYSQEAVHEHATDTPPFPLAGQSSVGLSTQRHDAIEALRDLLHQASDLPQAAQRPFQSTQMVRNAVDRLAQCQPLSSAADEALLLLHESVRLKIASPAEIIARLMRHRAYSHAGSIYELSSQEVQQPSVFAEVLFAMSEAHQLTPSWSHELASPLVLDILNSSSSVEITDMLKILDNTSRLTPDLLVFLLSSAIYGDDKQFAKVVGALCEDETAEEIDAEMRSMSDRYDDRLASAIPGFAALKMRDLHKSILWTRLLELAVSQSYFSAAVLILRTSYAWLPITAPDHVASLVRAVHLSMPDKQFLATDMRSILGYFQRCPTSVADDYLPDVARRFLQNPISSLLRVKYLRQICSLLSTEASLAILDGIPSNSGQVMTQAIDEVRGQVLDGASVNRSNAIVAGDHAGAAPHDAKKSSNVASSDTVNWYHEPMGGLYDLITSKLPSAATMPEVSIAQQTSDIQSSAVLKTSNEAISSLRAPAASSITDSLQGIDASGRSQLQGSRDAVRIVRPLSATASKSRKLARKVVNKPTNNSTCAAKLPVEVQHNASNISTNLMASRAKELAAINTPPVETEITSLVSSPALSERVLADGHDSALLIKRFMSKDSTEIVRDGVVPTIDPMWSTSILEMLAKAKHGDTDSCLSMLATFHEGTQSPLSVQAKVQFCCILYRLAETVSPETWLDFTEICIQKYGLFFGPRTFDRVVSRSIRQDEATAAAQLLPRLIKLSIAQGFDVGVRAKTIYRAITAFSQRAIAEDKDREGVSVYHLLKKVCKVNERLVSQSLIREVLNGLDQADMDDEMKMRSFPNLFGQKWSREQMHRYRTHRLQLRRQILQNIYQRSDDHNAYDHITYDNFDEIHEEDKKEHSKSSRDIEQGQERASAGLSAGRSLEVVQDFELQLMSGRQVNMEWLRTAVQACLNLQDFGKAEEFCRQAAKQDVYTAPAQLLILQERILDHDRLDHDSIRDMVMDWYRKMANLHPQVAHAALRAAVTRLTSQHRSAALSPRIEKLNRDAVNLMLEIHDSDWCKKIPFGIKEYTSLMTAYFNCSDLKGVYWTIATILRKNMPITVTFMRVLYRECRAVMTRLANLGQRAAALQYQMFWRKIIELCQSRRHIQRATNIKLQHAVMNVLLYDAAHPDVDHLVHVTAPEVPSQLDTSFGSDNRAAGLQQLHDSKHIRAQAIAASHQATRQAWQAVHPDHPDHPLARPDLEMTHAETLSVFEALADNEILRRKASFRTVEPIKTSETAKSLPQPEPVTAKWTEQDTRLLAVLKRKVEALRLRNQSRPKAMQHESWDLLQLVKEIKGQYRDFRRIRHHETALEQIIENKDYLADRYALEDQTWKEVMEEHAQVDWVRAGS